MQRTLRTLQSHQRLPSTPVRLLLLPCALARPLQPLQRSLGMHQRQIPFETLCASQTHVQTQRAQKTRHLVTVAGVDPMTHLRRACILFQRPPPVPSTCLHICLTFYVRRPQQTAMNSDKNGVLDGVDRDWTFQEAGIGGDLGHGRAPGAREQHRRTLESDHRPRRSSFRPKIAKNYEFFSCMKRSTPDKIS